VKKNEDSRGVDTKGYPAFAAEGGEKRRTSNVPSKAEGSGKSIPKLTAVSRILPAGYAQTLVLWQGLDLEPLTKGTEGNKAERF
jgi:hypothetical protein